MKCITETAKQNEIAPEDYLRCLFEKAPYAESEEDWKKLLLGILKLLRIRFVENGSKVWYNYVNLICGYIIKKEL